MTLAYQKEIVSKWFDRRGRHGDSPFDQFIYTWIALNAALSARYELDGDKRKIVAFADELTDIWVQWLHEDPELKKAATELSRRSPIYEERPRSGRSRKKITVSAEDPGV